jgi:hypothetical protein
MPEVVEIGDIVIAPGGRLPLLEGPNDLVFKVRVGDLPSFSLDASAPRRGTVSTGGRLIDVEIRALDGVFDVSLAPVSFPAPIMVTNSLPFDVGIAAEDSVAICHTRSTTVIGFKEFPYRGTVVHIEADMGSTTLDFREPGELWGGAARLSWVAPQFVLHEGPALESGRRWSVAIPRMLVSVIDSDWHEQMVLLVGDIAVRKWPTLTNISIGRVQLDDAYIEAPIPVEVCSDPEATFFSYTSKGFARFFELVKVTINPMTLWLDGAFLGDVTNLISEVSAAWQDNSEQKPAPVVSYSIGKFQLLPVTVDVSFRGKTGRPGHPFLKNPVVESLSITDARVSVDEKQFAAEGDASFVIREVGRALAGDFLRLALASAGRVDLVSGLAVFPNLGLGIKRAIEGGGYRPSVLPAVEGTLRGVGNILGEGGGADGVNESAGRTVLGGFERFGKGLFRGVTALPREIVKGAQEDGVIGALVGVGRGLGRTVGEPVAGVLAVGAGLVGGVRKVAFAGMAADRIRQPRVVSLGGLEPFDPTAARAENDAGLDSRFVFCSGADGFALSSGQWFVFGKATKPATGELNDVTRVTKSGRAVKIESVKGRAKSFEVRDEASAQRIMDEIRVRLWR